jgi:hypothetical protein
LLNTDVWLISTQPNIGIFAPKPPGIQLGETANLNAYIFELNH